MRMSLAFRRGRALRRVGKKRRGEGKLDGNRPCTRCLWCKALVSVASNDTIHTSSERLRRTRFRGSYSSRNQSYGTKNLYIQCRSSPTPGLKATREG